MTDTLIQFARTISKSPIHDHVVHWLQTVPGLPPIVQTVHIVSIALVMGSIVMIDLKVLGLALPSQRLDEMTRRLFPWLWSALVLLLLSGAMFVIARPLRYFKSPIFGFKMAFLVLAVSLAALFHVLSRKQENYWGRSAKQRLVAKSIAVVSLFLWLGVMMAGRWIAYADYLFPPE